MSGMLMICGLVGVIEVVLSAPIAISIYRKNAKKKPSRESVTLGDCMAMYNMGYSIVCEDGRFIKAKKEKCVTT